MIVRPRPSTFWVLLFTLRGSILPVIYRQVLVLIVLAAAVVYADHRWLHVDRNLNAVPPTLIGLTLAIFLGFRNNVAYQRWWEARSLWGEMVITLRNLARQTMSLGEGLGQAERRIMTRRLIAFAHALRHQLRDSHPAQDLQRWLPAAEATTLAASPNPANALLGMLGHRYAAFARETRLGGNLFARIDAELGKLSQVLGGCERIHGTPIPFAYILLLHRTVFVYCLLLPFCLVGAVGWLTPPVVGVLAYTFFGLDALGEQIQDPFDTLPNDLPLDAICRSIEISVGELSGEAELPPLLEPRNGVLL